MEEKQRKTIPDDYAAIVFFEEGGKIGVAVVKSKNCPEYVSWGVTQIRTFIMETLNNVQSEFGKDKEWELH